ncbi:hypothetical protein H6G80_30720 [Nostoc sp. FACHB-87]|uniref:hypothetical protein n=1 Tax=Nostocaceae TaxID=1162 RepID=UPI001683D9F8|nr:MULTISPECIES: hypothetical protein [Nostocaceae]MBD2458427.1 hypothetical protein [Nostoc sp. FACHB-87]MBD2479477.1 hypothetical protein [Anabaena sp. FACHB-83]
MIPNWSAIEVSFLGQPHPQQLGELAASLARLKSWCQKNASRELVPVLLSENLLYVNLLQQKNQSNHTELTQLQNLLEDWQQNWVNIYDNPTKTASLAAAAANWSERVLKMSGLLSTAVM